MNYEIIGSSSKGNCIIVEDILMLDCGVSYSKIKNYLSKVKLIFISHGHFDHLNLKTIKQVAYNYPNIKYIIGSREVTIKLVENGVNKKNVYYLKEKRWYSLGIIDVRLERLVHDVENYCLKAKFNTINKKMIYVVDTMKIDHITAKNYDLFLIESNYNEDLLKEHIENCEDEGMLKYLQRVPYTHLSDTQCNDFLIENMGEDSEYLKLHQSSYNYKDID